MRDSVDVRANQDADQDEDAAGEAFCRARSARSRRGLGQVFTPPSLVEKMLDLVEAEIGGSPLPGRVVDAGAGSGRFALAAARRFPLARIVAVETDPECLEILRFNAEEQGLSARIDFLAQDYCALELPRIDSPTLFLGNPPYVRHHDILSVAKERYAATAAVLGLGRASRLAGLHLHFWLHTARIAALGDIGCFITGAEWLDAVYGAPLRRGLASPVLGLSRLVIVEPTLRLFETALTTSAIASFRPKAALERPACVVRVATSEQLSESLSARDCGSSHDIAHAVLAETPTWSQLGRVESRLSSESSFIGRPLGEVFRVQRGQSTGCNAVWIAGSQAKDLPTSTLFPTITKARFLFAAGGRLDADAVANLPRVIDLPLDIACLSATEQDAVSRFLLWAKAQGAADTWTARHRASWHAVRLTPPAPILVTYMARRPPVFVRNPHGARHLNIAHGLYPKWPLSETTLDFLAGWLNEHIGVVHGRPYAGGLIKFEPRMLENLKLLP
ncbi:Type II methyltransferase M.XamI [Azospirillaceae bacterium]